MKSQIKNIQLVSPDNPFYRLYQSKFRSEKQKNVVDSSVIKTHSYTTSWVLEDVVREWIKSSGTMLEERIIMYDEYYAVNQFRRMFKELDYVLKQGDKLIIGELKVSTSNPRVKASKQTFLSSEIIKKIAQSFEVQIIWVDLCTQYAKEAVSEFRPNFMKSVFQKFDYNEDKFTYKHKFKFLHIDAKDIFKWGLENNHIKTPELVMAVLEESEIIGKIHCLKEDIILLRKDIKDNIENEKQIDNIKRSISIENAKLDIIQKGWTVQNKELENPILENSNQTISYISNKFCDNFRTENQVVKYIVFDNFNLSEIQLIDAIKVYILNLQNKIRKS